MALLGYGLWQRKYGGSQDVIGHAINLDNQSYTVIGVLPKGYELLQQSPDVVVAMGPWASKLPDDRSWHPGIYRYCASESTECRLSQARAEMSTIAKRLLEKYPADNIALDAVVNPMHEQLVSQAKPALVTLLGAVIFVLLIACGNIANLMLTRATARRREISIRISLGASDWQIIKQLVMEGLLLSLMGAIAGVGAGLCADAVADPPGRHFFASRNRCAHRCSRAAVYGGSVDLRRSLLRSGSSRARAPQRSALDSE